MADFDSIVAEYIATLRTSAKSSSSRQGSSAESDASLPTRPVAASCGRPAVRLFPGAANKFKPSSLLRTDPIVLMTQVGMDTIDDILDVGETLSCVVNQVLISRSEIRRRQEGSIALAGRRFDDAMRSELEACSALGVYVEGSFAGQVVISTRWVLTKKPAEIPNDPEKLKAQLGVRGFEDLHRRSVLSTSYKAG